RLDGRILVGSTLEFDDFDKTTSAEARTLLLQNAHSMVPNLKNAKVEAHWAGLRPGTAAGVPYIGKMPGWDNLYLNAGHFRNGLVLAPASARLMSNLILQQKPIIDPSPYDPARARILEPMH
ncbi:MAG: FAD-dependent oxidoreductase, partial [Pseudomonadales bacterium]|nr:FAD-dependent oxidoreductase [Pseudomonadales bacterium]